MLTKILTTLQSVTPGFAQGGKLGSLRAWFNAILPGLIVGAGYLAGHPDVLATLGVSAATATVLLALANLITLAKDKYIAAAAAPGTTPIRVAVNVGAILITAGQAWWMDLGIPEATLAQLTALANIGTMMADHWGGKALQP